MGKIIAIVIVLTLLCIYLLREKRAKSSAGICRSYGLDFILHKQWLAASVHIRDHKLPPAFDENNKYIDINIGDIMPMFELDDGLFAYYKTVESYRSSGGDWLYDTDKYKYDMEFTHVGPFKLRWTDEEVTA